MNITLDVQGHVFKTNYETIIKIPYFKNMFEDCDGFPSEIIQLDRSAHIFKHVLALMCNPFYQYPKKYISELDFYDINLKGINFYENDKNILQEIQNAKIMIERLSNKVNEMANDRPKYNNPFFNPPPLKAPTPWGDPFNRPPSSSNDPFHGGPNHNRDPFKPLLKPW